MHIGAQSRLICQDIFGSFLAHFCERKWSIDKTPVPRKGEGQAHFYFTAYSEAAVRLVVVG